MRRILFNIQYTFSTFYFDVAKSISIKIQDSKTVCLIPQRILSCHSTMMLQLHDHFDKIKLSRETQIRRWTCARGKAILQREK